MLDELGNFLFMIAMMQAAGGSVTQTAGEPARINRNDDFMVSAPKSSRSLCCQGEKPSSYYQMGHDILHFVEKCGRSNKLLKCIFI